MTDIARHAVSTLPRWLRCALAAALVWCALPSSGAQAQEPPAGEADEPVVSQDDRAAAQVLFDEGRSLLKDEKYAQACAKFAESMRLDRAIGTQLNLADCYEKLGKTASAWINWVDAATRARKEGQETRVKIAEERAAALEGKLSRMKVVVPYLLEGLTIKRDGIELGEPQWGIALPVDPGEHVIEASAPGKKPWKTTVKVGAENDNVVVEVAPLEDAPVEELPRVGPAEDDRTPLLAGGIVAGSVGLIGVGLGIGFGVLAMNKNDESLEHCLAGSPNMCVPEGVSLRNEALTFSYVSTAGFVIGGAGLVAGAVLLGAALSGDEEAPEGEDSALSVLPWVGAEGAGLGFGARW